MSEQRTRITLEGELTADGDCIYIGGMILANILSAALAHGIERGRMADRIWGPVTLTVSLGGPA